MRLIAVFPGFFLLSVLVLVSSTVQALDVASLSDPRPNRWAFARGPQVSLSTAHALDELGREVKNRTGHELVVVCVDSTDGENQRTFATRLFNRWQIGDRQRNDGLLLFVASVDRRVEIILGDGIDDDAQVAISQAIVDQDMLPRFRNGDRDGAVLNGARACAKRLLGLTPSTPNAPAANQPANVERSTTTLKIAGDSVPQVVDTPVELDTTRVPAPLPASTTPARMPSSSRNDYSSPFTPDSSWQLWGIAGGGGGGIMGFMFWRRWLRDRARACDHCQQPMVRLTEYQDDEHLDHGEQTEERIGSVDYDVWHCSACPHVLKLRYGTWFTSYARCPRCRAVTKSSSETTLLAATYDHGGSVQVDEACVACDYRNRFTRSTPQKTRPSTSGNRSSGFSGSGGRSSGGSSGGGGSSSGRGGGGGW